jgi:hypothetical protein
MFASTDISLISLIEHKQVMYAVVDYMDTHNTELVNEGIYIQAVRDLIATKVKKTEKQRLSKIFDLDNLISTGLVIEVDKNTRNILFHTAVIEVFRLFDNKRLRELTNADLQELSARLDNAKQSLFQHISSRDLKNNRDNLEEQIEMVFLLLSDISSKLQTNTRSLQSKAQHLAETIDANNDLTALQEVQQKQQTLAEIQKIYHRNILPMLEFLNEYEQMKGLSPLKKISAIHQTFTDFGYMDEAYRVQQYKIGITTHYKVIEEISQLLERYSRQELLYRKQYNAIESAYQALIACSDNLSDGKLNTQYFNDEDSSFNLCVAYYGLKQHRSAQKSLINWADIDHKAYLDEYLLNARQRVLDEASTTEAKIHFDNSNQQKKLLQQQHKQELQLFIQSIQLELPIDDIYQEIFAQIKEQLSMVDLADILYITKNLQLQYGLKLQVHFELPQSTLVYSHQKLNYWRREVLQISKPNHH